MKTNNKYYTPSIEEIHPGLEFELTPFIAMHKVNENSIWHKIIWCVNDNTGIGTLQRCCETDHIRIKYLDKEDIEELNFHENNTEKKIWYGDGIFQSSRIIGPLKYLLEYFYDEHHLIIHIHNNETMSKNELHQIFNGHIKNKSELKVLFQQLNIY